MSPNGELVPIGGGEAIPLIRSPLSFGRRASCDVILDFPNISGMHCELSFRDGYWSVRDLGSTNGIKVNGNRVTSRPLKPGDELVIGKRRYSLQYTATPEAQKKLEEMLSESENVWATSLLEKAGLMNPRSTEGRKQASRRINLDDDDEDETPMSSLPLAGKVAFVTGASGGIGAATVRAMADAGADIAGCDLRFTHLGTEALDYALKLGRRVTRRTFDIADQPAVEDFVKRSAAVLGGIDLHVSAAVYSDREPFTSADMDGFRKTIEISMWGSYYALRSVANLMIAQDRGGAVVIVSSPHAVVPFPNCMAYNMAKAAQDAMARTAAIELLRYRIRVNIMHPGWTDTPGERKFYSDVDIARVAPTLPPGRLAQPHEVARGILFLLDPQSDYINGTTLTMDGGLSLPWWSKRGEGSL